MKVFVLNNFVVGDNHLGKAVFAAKNFKKNDVILKFEGDILDIRKIPKNNKLKGESDRFLQIGEELFMGPSGTYDDFVNHSCNPNAGIAFIDDNIILLIAIKDIKIGQEITWDYSTTLFHNNWKMICKCGYKKCRKVISDFILLDKNLQKKYYKLNIIPPYLKKYMDSSEYSIYTKGVRVLKKYGRK